MRWPFGFARRVDPVRVIRAIAEAEKRTSGEIVVSVAPFFIGSVDRAAERAFVRIGVARTRDRNGVLFFVVPSRRVLVVLGDDGIHARVGQPFWEQLVKTVTSRFADGDPTGGLVAGIDEVGRQLAAFFPYDPATDRNELPDTVR